MSANLESAKLAFFVSCTLGYLILSVAMTSGQSSSCNALQPHKDIRFSVVVLFILLAFVAVLSSVLLLLRRRALVRISLHLLSQTTLATDLQNRSFVLESDYQSFAGFDCPQNSQSLSHVGTFG